MNKKDKDALNNYRNILFEDADSYRTQAKDETDEIRKAELNGRATGLDEARQNMQNYINWW